jgi:hypothetical protein
MTSKNKSALVVIGSFLAIAGVFAYIYLKRKKAFKEKQDQLDSTKEDTTTTPDTTPKTNTGGGSGGGASAKPLNFEETKKFQDWLDGKSIKWVGATNNGLTNGTFLKKDVSKGYGNFGVSTAKAWKVYGADYLKATVPASAWTSGFKAGEKLYLKAGGGNNVAYAYNYPSTDKRYLVGSITRSGADSIGNFLLNANTKGWMKVKASVETYDKNEQGVRIKVWKDVYLEAKYFTNVAP